MKDYYPLTHPFWLNKYTIGGMYDGHINVFVSTTKEDFLHLKRCKHDNLYRFPNFGKYKKLGFLNENILPNRVDSSISNVNNILLYSENRAIPRKLTIELTENCNLRCKYCRYTLNMQTNKGRYHNDSNISFETASKAISIYLEEYDKVKRQIPASLIKKYEKYSSPIIGFYGGEVLLCQNLFMSLVRFTKKLSKCKRLKTKIAITTNGTLLNETVLSFLIQNDVFLAISIDGPKSENDKNRVFPDGHGSFLTVNKWIDYLSEKYPDYMRNRVSIQAVDAPNYDKCRVFEYFCSKTKEDYYAGVNNFLELSYTDFSENTNPIQTHVDLKLLRNNLNRLIDEYDSYFSSIDSSLSINDIIRKIRMAPSVKNAVQLAFEMERKISNKPQTNLNYFNSCYLGRANLLVSVNGEYHICERTDFSMPIGNVNDGINSTKLRDIYRRYFLTMNRKKCRSCWCGLFCSLCVGQTIYEKNITIPNDNKCRQIQLIADHNLKLLLLLSHRHFHIYKALDKYFKNTDYISIDEFLSSHKPIN